MKTVKLNEEIIYTMKSIQTNMYEVHKLKLKTYNDVIEYLYNCFLEIDQKTEEKIIENAKEYFKDKSKK